MILPLKLAILVILIFLALFLSPSSLKAAFSYAPFLPTPKKAIQRALKEVGLKKDEKLYDLGSGTGKVLVIGTKEFGASSIGFEYSVPFFIFSKLNLFFQRVKNVKVLRQDFLETDLSKADVVFAFLTPKAFLKLKDKFIKEIKPGSRVITFSSPLLFWQPDKVIDLPDTAIKIYLYIKR